MPTVRFLSFSLAALALGFASPAASAAEVKIGYVDLQKALTQTEEGRVAKDRLRKDFDTKQKRLDKVQEDIQKDQEKLKKQGDMMKDDERRKFQEELGRKIAEATQLWQQMQKDLTEAEARETNVIFQKMEVIIREIAEAEGFSHVFDKKTSGLIYAPDSMDLTAELVRKYDARYPRKKEGGGAAKKESTEKKGDSTK